MSIPSFKLKKRTISKCIKQWEIDHPGQRFCSASEIYLCGMLPPIEKMDSKAISLMKNCEVLSLSTNDIDKIEDLSPLTKLKVLMLGRNRISKLQNLNVARTLIELHVSFNHIEKLKGIESLRELQVFSCAHNRIDEWKEFDRMKQLSKLRELHFEGNPLRQNFSGSNKDWRLTVVQRLGGQLERLDGSPIHIRRVITNSPIPKSMHPIQMFRGETNT